MVEDNSSDRSIVFLSSTSFNTLTLVTQSCNSDLLWSYDSRPVEGSTDREEEEASDRMWPFNRKGPSGFSSSSTAEEVSQGIDGTGLTAIVTGSSSIVSFFFLISFPRVR